MGTIYTASEQLERDAKKKGAYQAQFAYARYLIQKHPNSPSHEALTLLEQLKIKNVPIYSEAASQILEALKNGKIEPQQEKFSYLLQGEHPEVTYKKLRKRKHDGDIDNLKKYKGSLLSIKYLEMTDTLEAKITFQLIKVGLEELHARHDLTLIKEIQGHIRDLGSNPHLQAMTKSSRAQEIGKKLDQMLKNINAKAELETYKPSKTFQSIPLGTLWWRVYRFFAYNGLMQEAIKQIAPTHIQETIYPILNESRKAPFDESFDKASTSSCIVVSNSTFYARALKQDNLVELNRSINKQPTQTLFCEPGLTVDDLKQTVIKECDIPEDNIESVQINSPELPVAPDSLTKADLEKLTSITVNTTYYSFFVQTSSEEKQIQIKATKETSIAKVKEIIAERWKVPSDAQRILFKGKQLKDDDTLESCKVEYNSSLFLVERLRGD